MTLKIKRLIARLVLTLATVLVVVFVMAALTTPAKSIEPNVITDKLAQPVGPAQCWEAPDLPELDENANIQAALLAKANVIQDCTVTHYAVCVECCGKADGITASGVKATPDVSVAVDPEVIPLGSDVLVDYGDGDIQYYRADDVGGAVHGAHIDLCVGSYDEAMQLGVKTATVYWVESDT